MRGRWDEWLTVSQSRISSLGWTVRFRHMWKLIVPEIADFEVRRSLLLHQLAASVGVLNQLRNDLLFEPINSAVMLRAAELWAKARKQGQPTADAKELDCDVVLAAQAIEAGAIIATDNVGHLSRFATAVNWRKMVFLP